MHPQNTTDVGGPQSQPVTLCYYSDDYLAGTRDGTGLKIKSGSGSGFYPTKIQNPRVRVRVRVLCINVILTPLHPTLAP